MKVLGVIGIVLIILYVIELARQNAENKKICEEFKQQFDKEIQERDKKWADFEKRFEENQNKSIYDICEEMMIKEP